MHTASELTERLVDNLEQVIIGKRAEVELLVVALLARGHVLVEDVPGTGKTMLARALAMSIGVDFKRVQCTPDLLPSDITGTAVFNPKTAEFEFRHGPVFAGVLVADEINRATPRTQAALLEAMQERQVTADGVTRRLPDPFVVLATQNPVEYEGTFPLPEAQLDRFLIRLRLGYPAEADERALLSRVADHHPIEDVRPVTDAASVMAAAATIGAVHASDEIENYIVRMVRATRADPAISLGVSPRGSIALHRACRARAALRGRDYVIPDDVKTLAEPVLAHRIVVSPDAQLRGTGPDDVIRRMLESIPVHERD